MLRMLWAMTRGYRLHPWDSPYLRWRIETYSGQPADELTAGKVLRFTWEHRSDLLRYLRWGARMSNK